MVLFIQILQRVDYFAKISGTAIWNIQITRFDRRVVKSAQLSAEANHLDMASLQNGIYFYKANDAATGTMVAQGKVTKL